MTKNFIFLVSILSIIFFSGCEEENVAENLNSTEVSQGWHFSGRDCLACHNEDLQQERALLFGGTVYKNEDITDKDNLNNICGGDLVVNLYNPSHTTLLYSSKNFIDPNSKGNKGKGNIFILKRMLSSVYGDFFIEITDKNSNVLTSKIHRFSAQEYDINNPADASNEISCNACHSKEGQQSPIYVDNSKQDLCQ